MEHKIKNSKAMIIVLFLLIFMLPACSLKSENGKDKGRSNTNNEKAGYDVRNGNGKTLGNITDKNMRIQDADDLLNPDNVTTPENLKPDDEKGWNQIGEYTSPILDKTDARIHNINLAASIINGKVLQPGEEFSFNGTLGERTAEKGYQVAPVIIKTEDGSKRSEDIGGGICQISSTLFNAAEQAGLEITERVPHSKDIGYIPKGRDATVDYGSADLKFKNNKSNPVLIKIDVNGVDSLSVRILEKVPE